MREYTMLDHTGVEVASDEVVARLGEPDEVLVPGYYENGQLVPWSIARWYPEGVFVDEILADLTEESATA